MDRGAAELEIGLRWRPADDTFDVTIEFHEPDDANRYVTDGEKPLSIDVERLATLWGDKDQYGQQLTSDLFCQAPKIYGSYQKARAIAAAGGVPLHMRLRLDVKAPPKYQVLRWELMRDPEDGYRIATRNNISFSRYVVGGEFRKVSPPRKEERRALVVVAGPSNLDLLTPGSRRLSPVDVEAEIGHARTALGAMRAEVLQDDQGVGTLNAMVERLEGRGHTEQEFDLLYIVCHGAYLKNETVLYLTKPNGTYDGVEGSRLIETIRGLSHMPTLIVVSACGSAGGNAETSDELAFKALGHTLAEVGVPAVLALQGDFSVESARRFFPAFFHELERHGLMDRAVSGARVQIADRHDWWMPVLFSRL